MPVNPKKPRSVGSQSVREVDIPTLKSKEQNGSNKVSCHQIGLRRLRLRRMKFVREQFFLAAAAQNIKRLVRFLTQTSVPALAATTW
jgi:hypothetical protein